MPLLTSLCILKADLILLHYLLKSLFARFFSAISHFIGDEGIIDEAWFN
jgi:hypothetical protein